MTIALTQQDHGRTIAVEVGDDVVITLAELATAGFAWIPERVPDGVTLAIERPDVAVDGIGAAASVRVVLRIIGEVRGDLVLAHRQAWKAGEEDGRFVLSLVPRA